MVESIGNPSGVVVVAQSFGGYVAPLVAARIGARLIILVAGMIPSVLPITASQGTFHTGPASGDAAVAISWNGGTFSGSDNRAVTILESSTGDTTPPTTPAGLHANVFGDGETWLSWNASSDNAPPTGLLVYKVYLNGQFDQGISGGYTQAILYAQVGVLNTIDVFAVMAPATDLLRPR